MTALLLAHLLADFAFQTDWMVRIKRRGPLWVWPHLVVVSLFTLIAVAPAFSAWWPAALVVIATHAVIDISKVGLDRRLSKHSLLLFVLDQVLHLAVILGVSLMAFAWEFPPIWEFSPLFWEWAVGLTVSSFVVGIWMRVIFAGRRRFPSRWLATTERGAVTALVGAGLPLMAPLVPLFHLAWAAFHRSALDKDARFELAVGDGVAFVIGLLLLAGGSALR